MKVLALCTILLMVMAAVHAQTYDENCYPCDASWPRPYYYPNFDDCATVWECNQGSISLTTCDAGLVFDFLLQSCVDENADTPYTCVKLTSSTC